MLGVCLALAGCHNMLVQYSSPTVAGTGNFIPDPGISYSPSVLVDGTTATFTKNAGGFGTKTNVKPLYWIPLDVDFSCHPTLSRTTGALATDSTAVFQTAIKPPNASGAGRVNAGGNGGSNHGVMFTDPMVGTFSDMYCFHERYVDHSIDFGNANIDFASISGTTLTVTQMASINPGVIYPKNPITGAGVAANTLILPYGTNGTTGVGGLGTYALTGSAQSVASEAMTSTGINVKIARLWPGASAGGYPNQYWGSVQTTYCELLPGGSVYYDNTESLTSGAWHTDEHIFRASTLDVADGFMQFYRDGLQGYNTGTRRMTHTTTYPSSPPGSFYLDEYSNCSWLQGGAAYDYKHALYVDDSQKRIVVSNEASISTTSSTRAICIPTAWSDTSISCVLRQGALPSLSGKYLWAWTDVETQIRLGHWA